MTISEHLKLAYRNKILILFVTFIALICGFVVANNNQQFRFNNTIFYIFGVQDANHQTDLYENLQAADQITESIQGWFKDPSFLESINQQGALSYGLKSKKQDKNNLVITFTSDSAANGKFFSQSINTTLADRINSYNAHSDLQIRISSQSHHVSEKGSELGLYLFVSLLLGIVLGQISALLFEFLRGKLSTRSKSNKP